jgi:signal transduction histidine kinase
MRKFIIKRLDISWLLAVFAACTLIGINELGFRQSADAAAEVAHIEQTRSALNQLLQDMVDGETGQRGYLLTGNADYLVPYAAAMQDLAQTTEALRQRLTDQPADLARFDELARHLSRKLAEMELSVRMRKDGKDDAWKFVLTTDVGKKEMDAARALVHQLIDSSSSRLGASQLRINRSLQLSRLGIAGIALLALFAFHLYLQQTRALDLAGVREQESLKKERDALEEQVRERTANLAELASHLQFAREDERGHLARELHDELGALLTAAKLDVARLRLKMLHESPEARERLDHLVQTLNSGIALKRRIVEDLRPSSLTHLGLATSLEILTREFSDATGVQIECDIEPVDLDEARQLTVYRLVQESLTNAGKYAQASHIRIGLHDFQTHVTVEVKDDGKGFDTSSTRPSSYGLLGMKHRVGACGGRLTVTSSPGQGTLISAVIPRA